MAVTMTMHNKSAFSIKSFFLLSLFLVGLLDFPHFSSLGYPTRVFSQVSHSSQFQLHCIAVPLFISNCIVSQFFFLFVPPRLDTHLAHSFTYLHTYKLFTYSHLSFSLPSSSSSSSLAPKAAPTDIPLGAGRGSIGKVRC